jgi:hypothetical protein
MQAVQAYARFRTWSGFLSYLSNTDLQGALRLTLFAFMHTMIRSMLGISELHSLKTSGMQAARSSAVTAPKLAVGHAMTQRTTPSIEARLRRLANDVAVLMLMSVSVPWFRRPIGRPQPVGGEPWAVLRGVSPFQS